MKLPLIPIFVPFFISIRSFSSAFCVFLYSNVYPGYCQSYKNISIGDFVFKNFYKRTGLSKESSY